MMPEAQGVWVVQVLGGLHRFVYVDEKGDLVRSLKEAKRYNTREDAWRAALQLVREEFAFWVDIDNIHVLHEEEC